MLYTYTHICLFREGKSKVLYTDIISTTAEDLGNGTSLYFQFAKSTSILFLVLTILSIPSFILCFNGSRVPVNQRDNIGLYRFTIGNIGYDPKSLTYFNDSSCVNQTSLFGEVCKLSY